MSTQLKHKGKCIKKTVLEKRLKASAAMQKARQDKSKTEQVTHNLLVGRRIVDLNVLSDNLECCKCKKCFSLKNTVKENHFGLHSILDIRCADCSTISRVATGKMHHTNNNAKHTDVNTKAVLGAVHAGIGCTALNKLLSCLNIPIMSPGLYKRYEREIGPALEEAAKDSCRRAAKEERELIIKNVDKLCEQ
ncbi:hypothetical protein PV326_009341, partial [Microctonus aethiopoides]